MLIGIQPNGVDCFYGAHQAPFDITLDRPQGEMLVLFGPSGTGKNSLLRIPSLPEMLRFSTLNTASSHFDFTKIPFDKAIRDLRCDVDMVFQQYNLWSYLTVQQNLTKAPCRVLGLSKDQALIRVEKLLGRLRLKPYGDRYPLHLSGGQQQHAAVTHALMTELQVLLFDEPAAALDPKVTTQIVDIIHELAGANITRVVTIREAKVACKTVNRMVYMGNDHVVEQDDASCLTEPQVEAFKNYLSH